MKYSPACVDIVRGEIHPAIMIFVSCKLKKRENNSDKTLEHLAVVSGAQLLYLHTRYTCADSCDSFAI